MDTWALTLLAAIVLEGALRKWLLPASLHPVAYVAKYVIAAAFIATHRLPARTPSVLRNLRNWFLVAAMLLVPAFALGLALSPMAALLTANNAVLWPLFAIHFAANANSENITCLGRAVMLSACGMACLALVQFALPPTHVLNRYAWDAAGIDTFVATMAGDSVRATGTFSYISGLGSFGVFAFAWSIWRLSTKKGGKALNVLALLTSLTCVLTSGSRAPMIFCCMSIAGTLIAMRHIGRLVEVGLTMVIVLIALWFLPTRQVVDAFVQRAQNTDTFEERAIEPLGWFIAVTTENPFGRGLGQDSQTTVYADSRTSGVAGIGGYEDGRSRAAYEGGLLALLSLLLVLTGCLDLLVRGLQTSNFNFRAASGAFGSILCCQIFQCLWFDHVTAALYWLLAAAWMSTLAVGQEGTVLKYAGGEASSYRRPQRLMGPSC